MNLFFDTNIIIAYSFDFDIWHEKSEKLFNNKNKSYWSQTVKNESSKKVIELLDEYKTLVIHIIKKLHKKLISKEFFISFVEKLRINKKITINRTKTAEIIWANGKWDKKVENKELIDFLWTTIDNLFDKSFKKYNYCKSNLKLHIRKKEYKKLLKKINSLKISNKRIHKPDNLILLDAHDLASNNIKINFITADKRLLEFKKFIKKITEITEMTFIKISIIYKTIEGYNRKIRTCQT